MIIKNLILCTTSPQYTDVANTTPHGYSWFDGLLRNPRSGVQTPQVLGYSPIRAALILGQAFKTPTRGWGPTGYTGKVCAGAYRAPRAYDRGFKPLRGVILRGRGLGSHMSNQGTLWRGYPGERNGKTIRPTWDRTPGVGQRCQLVSHQ